MNRNGKSRAARVAWKAAAFFCVFIFVLIARPAAAADLAMLRNGFSIRHDHRQVMGATTRLFFSADDSSFTDVPTDEITGYERDFLLPVPADSLGAVSIPAPTEPTQSALRLNEVADTASATFHLDPDLVQRHSRRKRIQPARGFSKRRARPDAAHALDCQPVGRKQYL